jgi:hypothetical protein
MIVITGPGRSGTSLIARIYSDLGFNPGGKWNAAANAGLEDSATWRLNRDIAADLGVSLPVQRPVPRSVQRVVERFPSLGKALRARQMRSERFGVIRWDRFDEVVAKHRDRLIELSEGRTVVKDPRFSWTLGVWLAAGCHIEHVLVSVRDPSASARSRLAVGLADGFGNSALTNVLTYGVGVTVACLAASDTPWNLVRFPAFVDDPDQLYSAARFPVEVPRSDFLAAFDRIVDPSQIRHGP